MRGTWTPKEALRRLAHEIEIEQAKRKELRLGE
jgi:hypothetical protein